MSSTTASIIKEYLTVSGVDKRIDFCMYIESSADASAPNSAAAIDDLRASLPQNSINHTSCIALGPYPMSVSLETKRTGHDYDNALLQTGVWHSAQWKQLRFLLGQAAGRRLRSGSNHDGSDITGANDTSQEASTSIDRYVNDAVSKLQALHGILIQGHDWIYVASSPEELTSPTSNRSSKRTVRLLILSLDLSGMLTHPPSV